MKGLDARNPEALRVGQGSIWAGGKKGNIFEDRFYYVPKDFGWLGKDFKGVKSLVSGIGLKVTSIEGKNFTKDMSGVTFKSMRDRKVLKDNEESGSKMKRTLSIERVAYYRASQGETWELGKEICVVERKAGKRPIYLFFGFVEVQKGEKVNGRGYAWNFIGNKFLSDEGNCNNLVRWGKSKGHKLIQSLDGDYRNGDGQYWTGPNEKVILLGNKNNGGNQIWQFAETKERNALVGILMGIAVNLSFDKECDGAFGTNNGKSTSKAISECIGRARRKLEKQESEVTMGGNGGVGFRPWKIESSSDARGGTVDLSESWVERPWKELEGNKKKFTNLSDWKEEIELSYKYS